MKKGYLLEFEGYDPYETCGTIKNWFIEEKNSAKKVQQILKKFYNAKNEKLAEELFREGLIIYKRRKTQFCITPALWVDGNFYTLYSHTNPDFFSVI